MSEAAPAILNDLSELKFWLKKKTYQDQILERLEGDILAEINSNQLQETAKIVIKLPSHHADTLINKVVGAAMADYKKKPPRLHRTIDLLQKSLESLPDSSSHVPQDFLAQIESARLDAMGMRGRLSRGLGKSDNIQLTDWIMPQ